MSVLGTPALPLYRPPSHYTGEAFGVEYLLRQSGTLFDPKDLDEEIDDGIKDVDVEDDMGLPSVFDDSITMALPSDDDETEADGSSDNEVSLMPVIQFYTNYLFVGQYW